MSHDSITINLTPGRLFNYCPFTTREGVVYRFIQGRYRVICAALEARTRQQVVVYEGVGGADDGKCYTCPLADFSTRFLPVEEPAAAVAVEAPGQPAAEAQPIDGWTEWAQRWATEHGETVYLLPPGEPSSVMDTPSNLGCAVLKSQATEWHIANAVRIVEPERRSTP